MKSLKEINFSDLPALLESGRLKTIRIIVTALNAGVIFFLGVCFFLYFINDNPDNYSRINKGMINILLIMLSLLTISNLFFSSFISGKFLSDNNNQTKRILMSGGSDADKIISIINSYYIIRFALLEGGAFFGCIIFLLSIQYSLIYVYPLCWLSLVPALILFMITISIFPNQERIIELLKEKILFN